jgi:hypothetical protein
MELSLYWLLKKIPFAFRLYMLAAKVFDNLSIDTPQDIKEIYSVKKRNVHDKISKKYPEELITDQNSKFSQKLRNSYRYYADKFEFEARQKWGRPSQKYAYESAWSYSLAAEFYEKSGNNKDASDNYHYAGNAFRNLDAINQAIKHYQKSADLADSRDQWKLRNENRVKALKRTIGEEDA